MWLKKKKHTKQNRVRKWKPLKQLANWVWVYWKWEVKLLCAQVAGRMRKMDKTGLTAMGGMLGTMENQFGNEVILGYLEILEVN